MGDATSQAARVVIRDGTHPRRWRLGAVGLLVLATVTATAYAVTRHPVTPVNAPGARWTGDPKDGYGVATMARKGQVYSYGGLTMCLDRPGQAQVTGLAFKHDGGVTIRRYGVRQADSSRNQLLGSLPISLSRAGFPATSAPVTRTCGDDREPVAELGFEATNLTDATVESRVLVVSYRANGHPGTFEIPMDLSICAPKDDVGRCKGTFLPPPDAVP